MSLHTDVHRDRIIAEYKARSWEDLKAFTRFMISVSAFLCHADTPDVTVVTQSLDLYKELTVFVKKFFPITEGNGRLIDRMIHWPVYGEYEDDEILEEQAQKYADYPHPIIQALYREYCLPRVYEWLAYEWTVKPLTDTCVLYWQYMLALNLKEILVSFDWPDRYLCNNQVLCPICIELVLLRRWKTDCNHTYHRDCLYQWLQNQNTCPKCRRNVISC